MNFGWINTVLPQSEEGDRPQKMQTRGTHRVRYSDFDAVPAMLDIRITAASPLSRRPLSPGSRRHRAWRSHLAGRPQFAAAGPGRASGGTGLGGPAAQLRSSGPAQRTQCRAACDGHLWRRRPARGRKPRRGALGFPDPAGCGRRAPVRSAQQVTALPSGCACRAGLRSGGLAPGRPAAPLGRGGGRTGSGGVRGRGGPPFASLIGAGDAAGPDDGRLGWRTAALSALVARAAAHCPCHRGLSAGVSRAGPDGRRSRDGASGCRHRGCGAPSAPASGSACSAISSSGG